MCNCNSRMCMHALMLYSLCDGVFNAFFAFNSAAMQFTPSFFIPFSSPSELPSSCWMGQKICIKEQVAQENAWENWSRKLPTIFHTVHSCYQLTTLQEISHQQLAQNEKFSFHFTYSTSLLSLLFIHMMLTMTSHDNDDTKLLEMKNFQLQSAYTTRKFFRQKFEVESPMTLEFWIRFNTTDITRNFF